MKRIYILILGIICSFSFANSSFSQSVSSKTAFEKSCTYWNLSEADIPVMLSEKLAYNNTIVAWCVTHPDKGFVIISADSLLQPILAYGCSLDGLDDTQHSQWKNILSTDYNNRITDARSKNNLKSHPQWSGKNSGSLLFEQWPAPGSTPTGGWIWTNWKQSAPYNMLCPMDLNSGSRSVVGCPATAMAQIFNFHRTLNSTHLDETDDYYHSYGAGNQYWIDDDYLTRFFPSFPQLNRLLDSTESYMSQGIIVTDSMAAAISFAAGVAAKQVYTSSVSGTFGIDQALWAIERFGFDLCILLEPPDTTINARIAEDIKNALPVQLGLLTSDNTGGHNVVVDGYNTDEFYHFNFGWGGSANGWYTLPPTNIPYNLTIIEGAVVQIKSINTAVKPLVQNENSIRCLAFGDHKIKISGLQSEKTYSFTLHSLQGKKLMERSITADTGDYSLSYDNLVSGIYIYRGQ
ncbi:MAG: C10 family peptidase [Bacteroidales bacterium]|nr:C10 family peptidase [Bacteroidales bacterium]